MTQPSKAPYYLNSIFDQLKSESDYEEFYSSINNNARFVFTIPAYVTGLLLFYSGMLIGKTIKTEKMDHIRRLMFSPLVRVVDSSIGSEVRQHKG